MTTPPEEPGAAPLFSRLEDVVRDARFPDLDLALRAGRHIAADAFALYAFLTDAEPWLREFYDGFDCDLIRAPEQYWYLLPRTDRLGRRQLSRADMLVGMACALLLLDPATTRDRGRVARTRPLEMLQGLLDADGLARLLVGRRRTETVEAERVRESIRKALKRLAGLGFVDLQDGDTLELKTPLLRFADPVRDSGDLRAALEQLIVQGHAALEDEDAGDAGEGPDA